MVVQIHLEAYIGRINYAVTTTKKENIITHTLLAQLEEARDLSSRKYRFESVMGYYALVAEWNTQQAKNLWQLHESSNLSGCTRPD